MRAIQISFVDLFATMIYEAPGPCGQCGRPTSAFPLFSAEAARLRTQLRSRGYELTWLSVPGVYAVTPSSIWGRP